MPPRSNLQLAFDNLGRVQNHFLPAFTAAPTATTTPEIPTQLVLANRAIAEYDSATHAFHASVVQETSIGRSRLLSSIHDRFRLASPFYRIPVEIWVHIFKIMTSEDPQHDSLLPTHPRNVLCQVCRGWRHIVQSLPEMWFQIWLHKSWKVPVGPRNIILSFLNTRQRVLSDILRFSANIPLVIFIDVPSEVDLSEALVHHTLLTLVQHSHRWAALRIAEDHPHAVTRALESSREMFGISIFPLLRQLNLRLSDGPWLSDESQRAVLPFPDNALPNLNAVRLEHQGKDYRRIVPHLQSCTTIILYTTRMDEDLDDWYPSKEFTLPYLRTISVRAWDSQFFACMTAPKLAEILIEAMFDTSIGRRVPDFITKSHCSITSFSFGFIYWPLSLDPHILRDLLSSLPNLQTLALCKFLRENSFRDPDRILNLRQVTIAAFLTPLGQTANSQLTNCSSLRYLHISPTHPPSPHFSPELMTQLVEVIELRWRFAVLGVSGLCEVAGIPELGDGSFAQEHLTQYERLKALEGEGLKVEYAK